MGDWCFEDIPSVVSTIVILVFSICSIPFKGLVTFTYSLCMMKLDTCSDLGTCFGVTHICLDFMVT
jgi:hypothetical protein